jgi:hypothetical protein
VNRRQVAALAAAPLAWRSLAVLAAAVAAATQLGIPTRLPATLPLAPAERDFPMGSEPAFRPRTDFPEIARHPLFTPTRKRYLPPPAPAPAAVAANSPLHDYQLLGTVVDGGAGVALLKPPDSRETIRAIPGQSIAGWTLRKITRDTLQFTKGSASFALSFPRPRWPHQ